MKMENIAVKDDHGKTMLLSRSKKGRLVAPDFVEETVNNMPELPLNPDDILLCSYSKSGCHWIWEVIRYLKAGDLEKLDKVDKEAFMIEYNNFEQLAGLKSPRVLNNHSFFDDQPKDVFAKKVKVVFVYRNIKDVAVSFYYHHTRFPEYQYEGTFSQYLTRFMAGLVDNGSIFEYLRSWEEGILNTPELQCHLISYEDMKEDPVREIEKLSKFLGTRTDQEYLQAVADATDFDAMQKRKRDVTPFVDNNGEAAMYRKGKVGDWKNHFTVAESEWMDEIIQKELGNTKLFKFKYEIKQ